jgi:hypothetical protein
MSKIFYPTSEKLSFLLGSIHNREVALPDFQRDFVWDPRETEELIESICQNFPAGSLLRIKNSHGFFFAPREVCGAPILDGHKPSYLVLDGQQRLTSLYQAFYGKGAHRYFIHLGGLVEGADLEDCVFYERANRAERLYGSIEKQAESLTFPLARLWGGGSGFEEWLDQVLEARAESDEEQKLLKKQLREVRNRWIKSVEDYEFPMVTLAEDTVPSAVCTIFETLNRTGVKLSVFDLLAARFWPEHVRLRNLWEEARTEYPILSDFEIDPYYILQAVSLFAAKAAPSCKRNDVLQMDVSQINRGWIAIVKGLVTGLQMLRDDCGIVNPNWLPYYTILIPLSALFAHSADLIGPEVGVLREKVKRWFWCSVFGQVYEKAPNSQAAKDLLELREWMGGGKEPQSVAEFDFDVDSLRQVTPRQRAIYRGVIALILRNEARDFHTGKRITANLMQDGKIDDHHVFPKGYVDEQLPGTSATLRDCVLNRTLIDKQTNVRIGKKAPSEYLAEIQEKMGDEALQRLLHSHLLPGGADAPLRCNQFEQFLKSRQLAIGKKIQEITE